jgi:outer membrane receptor protein involved in Fe transport
MKMLRIRRSPRPRPNRRAKSDYLVFTHIAPFTAPSFTRHFRYNEVAWFGEDTWKLSSRLTVTAGLRWEYFGVLHSPGDEQQLDANFYPVLSAMIRSIRVIRVLLMRSSHDSKTNDGRRGRTNRITKLTCGWIAAGLPLQPKSPQQTCP